MKLTGNARDEKTRALPCIYPFVFIICLSSKQYRKKRLSATSGLVFVVYIQHF